MSQKASGAYNYGSSLLSNTFKINPVITQMTHSEAIIKDA